MTDDWLSLAPGESVEWQGRPRLSAALPSIAAGGALVVGGLVVYTLFPPEVRLPLLAVAVVIGLLTALAGVMQVYYTRYAITDRSLAIKKGVFARQVTTVPLEKVQDSSFRQGIAGTLLGYGTVSFDTAGGDHFSFDRIDDPQAVRQRVDRRRRGDDLPGTLDQWRAVRDEVTALRHALQRR